MTKLLGERGQATVEFALMIPVIFLVIVGLISFGKAFNYWLDLNHLANEGARWAVVNKVPPTQTSATYPQPKDLEQYLVNQVVDSTELQQKISAGFSPGSQATDNCSNVAGKTFCFCYGDPSDPAGQAPQIGDPVKVKIKVPYSLSFFTKLPALFNINLAGQSTQRLEQLPASTQLWKQCR